MKRKLILLITTLILTLLTIGVTSTPIENQFQPFYKQTSYKVDKIWHLGTLKLHNQLSYF